MTTKQRAILRALANAIEATMQIGKDGISENSLIQVEQMLEAKELIKIKVLENCDLSAKEVSKVLASKLNCEPVQVVGRMVVLYKRSNKKIKHIEL